MFWSCDSVFAFTRRSSVPCSPSRMYSDAWFSSASRLAKKKRLPRRSGVLTYSTFSSDAICVRTAGNIFTWSRYFCVYAFCAAMYDRVSGLLASSSHRYGSTTFTGSAAPALWYVSSVG